MLSVLTWKYAYNSKLYVSNIWRSAANQFNALMRLKKFLGFERSCLGFLG